MPNSRPFATRAVRGAWCVRLEKRLAAKLPEARRLLHWERWVRSILADHRMVVSPDAANNVDPDMEPRGKMRLALDECDDDVWFRQQSSGEQAWSQVWQFLPKTRLRPARVPVSVLLAAQLDRLC